MPISGTFVADFNDFNAAVAAAETKLVSFEAGGNKVTTSLERMELSLSGRKLIQDATLAAQAVDNIGGVSKLTEAEVQRLGAQASAAADKMRAMGIDVPPGIAKIAAEAKNADAAHQGLGGTVRGLITDFAAMSTARAAFNFVKDIVEDASALKDLSQQTHISVEELQLLAGGMSEFGVDADTLGKGLFKLSRGIAGGDESVATGLHLMGMSLKDVEGLQGKELFLKIESGLATLQGGLRDTAAADLFGGKLGAAMAGASEGIGGALDKWQALNHVASTESVEAMDAFGESITRAEKNLSSIAANMIGPVAQGFNVVNDAADKGASKWAIYWAMTKDALAASTGLGTGTENLTKLLDDLNKKTEENAAKNKQVAQAHIEVTAAVDTRTASEKFMAALESDAAVALTDSQLTNLAHLKEIGALNAKNAEGIGVNTAQFAAYTAAVERANKTIADATKAQAEAAKLEAASLLAATKLWDEYFTLRTTHGGTANDVVIAQIDQWAADLTAQMIKAGTDTDAFYEGLAAVSKEKLDGVGVDWDLFKTRSIKSLQEMADNAWKTYNLMADSGQFFRADMDKQLAKYHELNDAARGYGDSGVDAANRIAEAQKKANDELARAKLLADAASAANRAMGSTIDVATAAQDSEINALLKSGWSLKNAEAIKLARQWGFTPQLFDNLGNPESTPSKGERVPGYAGGVTNAPGGWSMVGEGGPERMYVPKGASIFPAGSGAGGGVTVNLLVSGVWDPRSKAELTKAVKDTLTDTLKMNLQLPR